MNKLNDRIIRLNNKLIINTPFSRLILDLMLFKKVLMCLIYSSLLSSLQVF